MSAQVESSQVQRAAGAEKNLLPFSHGRAATGHPPKCSSKERGWQVTHLVSGTFKESLGSADYNRAEREKEWVEGRIGRHWPRSQRSQAGPSGLS